MQRLGALGAVARHQLGELLVGDVAGGELRAQVAEQLHRQAHVLLDDGHEGLVDLAGVVELHGRDAQPLGVDLGGIGGVRAGHPAADVAVVADGAGEREPLARVEQRLHDEDVGQVHAAVEGIVHDEDVARRDVVLEAAHDRGHRRRHGPQMPRQREALRGELAVGVGKAGRVVHVVLQHARVGGPEDRERHLVGDREDRVLEELEGDRVCLGGHLRLSARMRFRPSRRLGATADNHALEPGAVARRVREGPGRKTIEARPKPRLTSRNKSEPDGMSLRPRRASIRRPWSGRGSKCWTSCWRRCSPRRPAAACRPSCP